MFVAMALVSVFAYFGSTVYRFKEGIAAEYNTASVIREVRDFASTHQGRSPRDWTDLPRCQTAKDYVRVRFDVAPDEFISDPELIHSVITPVTGEYPTYPHAHDDLEGLRQVLKSFNPPAK